MTEGNYLSRSLSQFFTGKLGRSTGSTESAKEFLAKPKSKEIASLLKKGKSTRDIAGRLGVSLNLVVKVRKLST